MKQSKFLSLGIKDIVKGFLVAALTVITTGLVASLENGALPDWPTIKSLLITGLCAGGAYVLKNFLTNSKDEFAKPEGK
jgi:glutaredoxin-related protein